MENIGNMSFKTETEALNNKEMSLKSFLDFLNENNQENLEKFYAQTLNI